MIVTIEPASYKYLNECQSFGRYMSGRSYEVEYFGNVLVNKFCSDAALHWAARDLSCKITARFAFNSSL